MSERIEWSSGGIELAKPGEVTDAHGSTNEKWALAGAGFCVEFDSLDDLAARLTALHTDVDVAAGKSQEGNCFRCGTPVSAEINVLYLDASGRDDCPASEDGQPHEIDPPDGWMEED